MQGDGITAKVRGLPDLKAALLAIPRELRRRALRTALAAGARAVRDEAKRDYDRSSWEYEMGEDGFVKTDATLENPRCVWNLLKAHVKQYTPQLVEDICGTPKGKFLKVA